MPKTEIGKHIKERRATLRITQEYLSELSGVGLRTLKDIESLKGNPTLKTTEKLLDVLGLELRVEIKGSSLGHETT